MLGLCLLLSRFVFLQVMHHDEFVTRAQNNRVKPRAIPPARGLIYDRNGVLLADNVPAFRLEVVPEQVKDMPKAALGPGQGRAAGRGAISTPSTNSSSRVADSRTCR